ncbi:hypothetical protein K3495_g6947 [Podosphaera aphanis]|nr:hypothetical protein K3495_g6947 [Podosphaera aphanis]
MFKRPLPSKTLAARVDPRIPIPTIPAKLKKRSIDPKVCGWIGGLADIPALCSGDSSCVRDTEHNEENHECYRNTYPGGYYQYGCGMSSWATQVETTYLGQPSDVSLQVLYSAITFSEMLPGPSSIPSSISMQTSPTNGGDLITSSSSVNVNSTSSIPSTSSLINPIPSVDTPANTLSPTAAPNNAFAPLSQPLRPGAIAGIIIGLVNGLAILAAIAFWLCRRRRIKRQSTNSEIRAKSETQSRQSGPLERIPPISPLPTRIFTPPNPRDALPPYTISDLAPATAEPTSPQQTFFITAAETEDFSCGFNDIETLHHDADADAHSEEHDPEIGIAISSDRQSLLRPDQQSSSCEDGETSTGAKSKLSRRSRSGASESDEDSMISPLSDEDDVSLTTSIRPATHPWRGNEARYHLVDQVINEET